MKKFIFTLMFVMLSSVSFAKEKGLNKECVGYVTGDCYNPYIYKICVDNYEYILIRNSKGGTSITQAYERVVDNEGRVIALPKMCSLNDGITDDE